MHVVQKGLGSLNNMAGQSWTPYLLKDERISKGCDGPVLLAEIYSLSERMSDKKRGVDTRKLDKSLDPQDG